MRVERFGRLDVVVLGGNDDRGGGDGPLVVALHGFGAPGDDLVGLAEALELPAGTRIAFPAAPIPLPARFYGPGRAWWMIDLERLQREIMLGRERDLSEEVPPGLDSAREHLIETLDALESRLGVPPGRTVIGGFSQGAMLSCDVALRTDRPLAGLFLLSGTLVSASEWEPRMPHRRGLKVFQSHGLFDPLLPFRLAVELRDRLQAAGLDVEWIEFPGEHTIPSPVLERLGAFFRRVLAE